MKLIDFIGEQSLKSISIYLTRDEADWMRRELERLLRSPEANEHFHVSSQDDSGRELSCSIITEDKLRNPSRYSKLEKRLLSEK